MTDQRIAEIKARCEAATEGPWEIHNTPDYAEIHVQNGKEYGFSPVALADASYNADFIAHSREDIPYLLTQLAASQAREKGCDYCGLIYKLDGASYGTTDEIIDNKFCPMCGTRLPVNAGTIGGEIVKHAMKEMEK